ncbi:MAG: NAD(+) synthase [Oscillospiraceae bacterium]|nr:NAD(+) synthase [Oscillospiraceae bacterium]MDD4414333.1 NAD(+) synthase [Oscillospiraceae bacterium]
MKDGFLRVAAATPKIKVADCVHNSQQILDIALSAPADTALIVFPELCIIGYTCGVLIQNPSLLTAAENAVAYILEKTVMLDTVLVLGAPVAYGSSLYNCGIVCHRGRLLGIVPKSYLPAYGELYESRYFAPANDDDYSVVYAGQDTVISRNQLFICRNIPDFCLGVEICEDLLASPQPSQKLAASGATVIANLSASPEGIGKPDFRRKLVGTQSSRLLCAYLYADAGEGESTTDAVFSGHNMIAENGTILAESPRYKAGIISADIDLSHIVYDRRRISSCTNIQRMSEIKFDMGMSELSISRKISPMPFIPQDLSEQEDRFEEILNIQSTGLAKRLEHTGGSAVLGLSGGLDSALALLVIVRAYDRLGIKHKNIHAVTLPCFGTTGRTLNNARSLANACGATLYEIDITKAVTQHFADIGHSGKHDTTYENSQARERTQVLMDIANQVSGMVIGPADLSEMALGWTTYNGDHMSMYGVNSSVPKTLVRHIISYEARQIGGTIGAALTDILNTPVSPELLPPENGEISQKTEQIVGPYELHDFFLYYFIRFGDSPGKIKRLAGYAFKDKYTDEEILKWLRIFYRRFFAQQFKRSCMPDGPRVGSVGLSPRSDWRMPSDAQVDIWMADTNLNYKSR